LQIPVQYIFVFLNLLKCNLIWKRVCFHYSTTDAVLNIMQNNDSLTDLIDIVKRLGEIYREENLRVDIDFDPNDGMTVVKYEDTNTVKKSIFINSNNKTISGIDTTKFWLPDYSNIQKANKKVVRFLEGKGYNVSNMTYRKRQRR